MKMRDSSGHALHLLVLLMAACTAINEGTGDTEGSSSSPTSTTAVDDSTSATSTTASTEGATGSSTSGSSDVSTTDDANTSSDTGGSGTSTGPVAFCGNGEPDPGEACDDGDDNSDAEPDACRTNCEMPRCGDAVVDGTEDCDDANADPDDGCSATCGVELGFECDATPSVCGPASILVNGDFEDSTRGDPIVTGRTFPEFPEPALWFADLGVFVPAEAGITPHGGVQMLRFDATAEQAGGNTTCNIEQVIDLAPYADLINAGRVTLHASAFFNRVDSATDSQFQLRIRAFSGSSTEGFSLLSGLDGEVLADLLPGTWEEVSVPLPLPAGTTVAVLSLNAVENVDNNSSAPEFEGHFADTADVRIVVAPPGG